MENSDNMNDLLKWKQDLKWFRKKYWKRRSYEGEKISQRILTVSVVGYG